MPGSPTTLLRSPTGFCKCRADASSRRAVRYSGCPDGQVSRTGGYRIFQALQLSYDRRAVGPVAQLCPDETVSLITFCLQIVFTVAERSREVIRLSAEIAVFVDLRYGFFWSYADFNSPLIFCLSFACSIE